METTNKETKKFIKDLRKVFKKHKVYLDVCDDYDGEDRYCGQTIEIRSLDIDLNDLHIIYLNDMGKLSQILYK